MTIYTVRNGVVRVEDSESTLYASIDVVCDKVYRKLAKLKERAIAKGKWAGRAGPKAEKEEAKEFQEYMDDVRRCKLLSNGLCVITLASIGIIPKWVPDSCNQAPLY